MPEQTPPSILAAMDDVNLTVTLELRIDGDTLSGQAIREGFDPVEFDGWLGLVGALDALVQPTSVASSGRKS